MIPGGKLRIDIHVSLMMGLYDTTAWMTIPDWDGDFRRLYGQLTTEIRRENWEL